MIDQTLYQKFSRVFGDDHMEELRNVVTDKESNAITAREVNHSLNLVKKEFEKVHDDTRLSELKYETR
jgi:hypothetical protein